MDEKYILSVNEVLKDIYYKHISILDPERKTKVRVVEFIGNEMVSLLKKRDKLFELMFQGFYHQSSYINGARSNNSQEYDLILSLRLPLNDDSMVKFTDDRCDPGYATCAMSGDVQDTLAPNMRNCAQDLKHHLLVKSTEGWKLGPGRTREWIYSIVLKLTNDPEFIKIYTQNDIQSIRVKGLKSAGTATTLEIKLKTEALIELDVVPSFEFKCLQILHLSIIGKILKPYWSSNLPKTYQEFGDIAKYDNFSIYDTNIPKPKYVMNKSQWRLDFIEMEKRILYENGCAKMVVELLECFRDRNREIEKLSNYVLKTIVLLVIKENPSYTWEEKFLSAYFLLALKTLLAKLEKKKVSFYFHPVSNIIGNISFSSIQRMVVWLKNTLITLKTHNDTERLEIIWRHYFTSK